MNILWTEELMTQILVEQRVQNINIILRGGWESYDFCFYAFTIKIEDLLSLQKKYFFSFNPVLYSFDLCIAFQTFYVRIK